MKTLVPVLGDQLSLSLSSLRDADRAETVVLMMEVAEETTYVRHHKQKIAYILSAMRHHAAALARAGWTVDYVRLDDPDNAGSFTGEIARAVQRHAPERIVVTEAGEWRVAAMIEGWETLFGIPSISAPTIASSPATPSSTPGRRGARSCGWSSSTARCGARPDC